MLKGLLFADLLAALLCMTAAFWVARERKRLDIVDLVWSPTFVIIAAIVAGYEFTWRTVLVLVLVDAWAIRLVSHLSDRAKSRKDDPRYKAMSRKWKGNLWRQAYLRVFLFQGLLVWLISLPVILAAGKSTGASALFTVLGLAVWAQGFVVEAIADKQLKAFVSGGTDKGEVLQSGLWRYSRHPNYYGEISQWFGIALIACSAHNGWIGLLSPLVLTATIVFISGLPPIEKRRRGNLEYQEYKRRTSPLLPWFPKN